MTTLRLVMAGLGGPTVVVKDGSAVWLAGRGCDNLGVGGEFVNYPTLAFHRPSTPGGVLVPTTLY